MSKSKYIVETVKAKAPPVVGRNPFVIMVDRIARPYRRFEVEPERSRVRVALVSMPRIRRYEPRAYEYGGDSHHAVDHEAVGRSLIVQDKDERLSHKATFLKAAEYAAAHADVVCFSELAFPTTSGSSPEPQKSVMTKVQSLSRKQSALIVAGTFHDHRTLMNTGLAFVPDGPSPVPFHKHISAISYEERVDTPALRKVVVGRAFGLNLALLICLDIADYNIVSAAVRCADQTHLMLVCCSTEGFDDMEKVAAAASRETGCYVAMVNSRWHTQNYRVLASGERLNDLPVKTVGNAQVALFSIDAKQVRLSPRPVGANNGMPLFGPLLSPVNVLGGVGTRGSAAG